MKSEYHDEIMMSLRIPGILFRWQNEFIPIERPEPTHPQHPESEGMDLLKYEGLVTIRFESGSISHESRETERDHFIKSLMGSLRNIWKLSGDQFCWFSVTEYGESEKAHCHIAFSFDPLRRLGKLNKKPDLSDFETTLNHCILFTCEKLDIPRSWLNSDWRSAFSNKGLVNYVCKVEAKRPDYKHFLYSKTLKKEVARRR